MLTFEYTNEALFDSKAIDVDFSGVRNRKYNYKGELVSVEGDISVDLKEEGWKHWTGEFSLSDFEEDFGFKIVSDEQ